MPTPLTKGARPPRRRLSQRFSPLLLVWGLALSAPTEAWAESLRGVVVAIQDGDTLTLLETGKTQHRIRLAGIDAPERRQPFGQRSKEGLSDRVYLREVTVEWNKRDRYGRVVGKVLADGRDVNLMQINAGLAWHYVHYAMGQSPNDRSLYSQAEGRAREAHLGLWQDASPIPPWDFRKVNR